MSRYWKLVSICCCLSITGIGCGRSQDGPERVVVSGAVTWEGHQIADGHLKFVPISGTDAPVSTGSITDGKYRISNLGGVAVGTYRVEITAYRTLPPAADNHDVDPTEIREQFLPPQFNVNSEMELTVPAGVRQMQHDFDLRP